MSDSDSFAQYDLIASYDVIFHHENFEFFENPTFSKLQFVNFPKMVTNPFSPCWGKCIKIFLIDAIVLLLVPLQLQRLSLWQAIEPLAEVVKFGTQIKDSMNINHSKFGVSDSNSLAPPSAQICTHVYAFRSQGLKTWFLHFQTRIRQFVELSLKLAWIIFRPCWVNVINVDRSNQSFIIQNLMPKYMRL